MFSRLLLIVALTLPMGACMSAAEREREMREVAASDDAGCRNSGTKPGTPAYAKCREDIANLREMQPRIMQQNLQWSLQGH